MSRLILTFQATVLFVRLLCPILPDHALTFIAGLMFWLLCRSFLKALEARSKSGGREREKELIYGKMRKENNYQSPGALGSTLPLVSALRPDYTSSPTTVKTPVIIKYPLSAAFNWLGIERF